MIRFVNILFVFVALFVSSCTKHVKVYPAPEGIELSNDFQVEVEGMKVPVYKTKIPRSKPVPRLNFSRSEFGFASNASFDMNQRVTFRNITATSAPIDTTLTGFQDGADWKPYIIRDHASMELIGYDENHLVAGVSFENVLLDGNEVEAKEVTMNDFVKDVKFK